MALDLLESLRLLGAHQRGEAGLKPGYRRRKFLVHGSSLGVLGSRMDVASVPLARTPA